MSYSDWVKKHYEKHKIIVEKLLASGLDEDKIIEYFNFENMKKKELDFCPLYKQNKKCHDMQELNCYLCSCPNFRFNDNGIKMIEDKIQYSFCSINSKDGKVGVYGTKIHQNCTNCKIPHTKEYVKKHFNLDWMEIMSKSQL